MIRAHSQKQPAPTPVSLHFLPMKSSAVLLVLSLAANVSLGVVLVRRPAVRALFDSSSRTATADAPAANKPVASLGTTENIVTGSWTQLRTGDLADTVARLRAEGVPPRILRAIMGALVAERFAEQRRAILTAIAAKPWWRGNPWEAYSDPEITSLQRKLAIASREELYRLLGPEAPANDYDRAYAERKYGPLTPDQTEKFRRINRDYDDLMAEVRAQAKGIILPEDSEKLAYFESEKRKDVAALLTAEELFEFNLRSSPTAKRVRDQLAVFDPTEEEFRAIFKIQQAIDEQFGDGRVQNLTAEERRLRRDLSNATGEQVRVVLSPERFAEYQLKTDPVYITTNQVIVSLSLPATATAQVVAVQKDITARMQAAVADRSLTGPQRNAQFAALAQQATQTLTTTLGAEGLDTYKQAGAGNWLTNLERRGQLRTATPKAP